MNRSSVVQQQDFPQAILPLGGRMLLSEKNKSSLLVADHQYHESKNARALPVVLLGTANEECDGLNGIAPGSSQGVALL